MGDRKMKALEKAKKKYWYDHNFDKSQNHWDAHVELSIFAEGWKAALRWAKAMHDVSSEPRFSLNITEELNGTSEKK